LLGGLLELIELLLHLADESSRGPPPLDRFLQFALDFPGRTTLDGRVPGLQDVGLGSPGVIGGIQVGSCLLAGCQQPLDMTTHGEEDGDLLAVLLQRGQGSLILAGGLVSIVHRLVGFLARPCDHLEVLLEQDLSVLGVVVGHPHPESEDTNARDRSRGPFCDLGVALL
jgi:hypothetical protein